MGKLIEGNFGRRPSTPASKHKQGENISVREAFRDFRQSLVRVGQGFVNEWKDFREEYGLSRRKTALSLGRLAVEGFKQAIFEIKHPEILESELRIRQTRSLGDFAIKNALPLDHEEINEYTLALHMHPNGARYIEEGK